MTLIVLKIVFVGLLCIPVAILAVYLFTRLIDEYIQINKEKKAKKERERKALEQSRRRRGLY